MLAAYVDLKKAFDSVHLIFAESLEVLVMALEALHEEAKPLGLEVSWLKTKVQGSPSNGPKDVLCLTCASPGASVSVYTRVDNAEPLLTLLGLALRRPLGGITVHSDAVCARCHAHFRLMHRLMARLDRLARRTALGFNKASRWFAKQQQKGAEEECPLVLKDSECSIVGQALAVAAAARKAALRTKGPAERKFECPMCGKKFRAYSHRVEHMVVHTRERAFQCSECGFQTSTKSNLARHRQRHTQEHRCHHCGRTLANKFSLKEHLRSHVGERPHHCNECNKSFVRRNELRIHERSHGKGEGQCHECPECHKTFVLRSRLTRHMLVHRQEKQYVCYVCKKEFTRKDDLKCHERIHTGEKPYTCHHCGRTFRYNTNFHCHLRTHQRLGLSCTLCNMTFPTQGKYSTHLKSRNHRRRCEAAEEEAMEEAEGLVEEEAITGATNGVPELKCEVCGLILESLDQLAAHTLASHVTAPILPHAADRSIIISGMGMGEEDRVVSFSQLEGVSVMVEVDRDTRSYPCPYLTPHLPQLPS
ncbi:Zinc finger protein 19 [Chionoecetes opilio]|uniref:Zinc finger protein 19 n=1 Tax=Chionoecetes opilio TaxID=41210 RepID=A0A8J4XKN9_CHIOP|nr:Zinc finger protein 19 [Chionoecetes opilio]